MFLVNGGSGYVENFSFAIFSDIMNVKLCVMVLLFELYLFSTLSVTLTIFQGHSNVKQFYKKKLCSYLIKLKLCRIVIYIS